MSALPTGPVIGILGDNLRLRGSVLPIPARRSTRWTRGLDLPRGGETVLYTGQMPQLVPYIEGLVRMEERLGGSPLARLTGFGRRVNRVVSLSALMTRPSAASRAEYDAIPAGVAALLRRAGVRFGCLYEDDLYSGALAWDLGLDDLVAAHARKVADAFAKHGVREAITIDPHTTHMLRTFYPKLLDGFDVRVRSYLEVLAEAQGPPATANGTRVALHDSCVFARYENVVDEPRALLQRAGVAVAEPAHTGRLTWCCGGPAESLYPEKAAATAAKRVAELAEAAPEAVTMCPLCLVNLRKAANGSLRVRDISHYLLEADHAR